MQEAWCNRKESKGVRPVSLARVQKVRFYSRYVTRKLSNKGRHEGGNESAVDDEFPRIIAEGAMHPRRVVPSDFREH